MKKKNLLVIIIISLVIPISSTYLKQANGYKMTYRMTYGNFAIVWDINELGTNSYIDWTFRSFSINIGVKVNIMDSYDFWRYNVKLGDYGITASNGTKLRDSGIFQIPYTSKWYVVFSINDIDALNARTDVRVEVDFITENRTNMILGLSIGLPISVSIIGLMIFGFLVRKKKKAKLKIIS